jgi:hypothetical protein
VKLREKLSLAFDELLMRGPERMDLSRFTAKDAETLLAWDENDWQAVISRIFDGHPLKIAATFAALDQHQDRIKERIQERLDQLGIEVEQQKEGQSDVKTA